ncbi:hypothetical protein PL11201_690144 [Planktothrix sp. PCC 11201]|uniref:hypothetical protein n=1 Tax=Planktothrix sp. PCC 11201 TaxID=1729650 RepID=UPI00091E2E73|nr:hypothetical protein [Planktothrix sp. PCC 11201]SKB15123.1 hypothetical protein PL11201_690144 [Planktothrix sp. PCC 11201]
MTKLRGYLDKNPQQTKRLLGMEYEQLIELIQAAELLEQEKRQELDKGTLRFIIRASGLTVDEFISLL